MKKIVRGRFKSNDNTVIIAMHKYYMGWCMNEKCASPIYMASILNYDCYSLIEAMREIYPDVEGYKQYTIPQWAAFLSLYDDYPIFKECCALLKKFI